jgi:hypothetical protein
VHPTMVAQLASAVLGFIGTGLLFFNSYSLQPREGAVWGSDAVTKENERITAMNHRRVLYQRTGFAFLSLSFIGQIAAVFL